MMSNSADTLSSLGSGLYLDVKLEGYGFKNTLVNRHELFDPIHGGWFFLRNKNICGAIASKPEALYVSNPTVIPVVLDWFGIVVVVRMKCSYISQLNYPLHIFL